MAHVIKNKTSLTNGNSNNKNAHIDVLECNFIRDANCLHILTKEATPNRCCSMPTRGHYSRTPTCGAPAERRSARPDSQGLRRAAPAEEPRESSIVSIKCRQEHSARTTSIHSSSQNQIRWSTSHIFSLRIVKGSCISQTFTSPITTSVH